MSAIQLENVVESAMIALNKFNEQKSCIISTAVLIDTINKVIPKSGIYPLTVEASVLNPKQTEQLKLNQQVKDYIVVGSHKTDSTEYGWSGHLVAILPEVMKKKWLIDLSIIQANSQKEEINLYAIISNIKDHFDKYNKHIVFINNCSVIYRPFPKNISYMYTELWKDVCYRKTISNLALETLNKI